MTMTPESDIRTARDKRTLARQLRQLQPGEMVVYHMGHLAHDREIKGPLAESIGELADAAWSLARSGAGVLYQQRLPDGGFAYFYEARRQ